MVVVVAVEVVVVVPVVVVAEAVATEPLLRCARLMAQDFILSEASSASQPTRLLLLVTAELQREM